MTMIDFLIVAFSLFMVVKVINRLRSTVDVGGTAQKFMKLPTGLFKKETATGADKAKE